VFNKGRPRRETMISKTHRVWLLATMLAAAASAQSYSYTVLVDFGSHSLYLPQGNLMRDTAGNIFGTTWAGGSRNFGTVYKVGPSGQDIVVLYTFQGGSDGANPTGFLIQDSAGNLYGTTLYGGLKARGVLFRLTPQ